jgi:hypothetical protein
MNWKLILFLLLSNCSLFAQIKGRVTDANNEPLPFASVYLKNTTIGTSANSDGEFSLSVPRGRHEVVFQYMGYKVASRNIENTGELIELNVALEEDLITIQEVQIIANAEDPAYAIIRKAIEKRPYYRDLVDTYTCDVYMKGIVRLNQVPEQFRSDSVTTAADAFLDSTGRGILYLSESESEYFYKDGERKEVMKSSKVSGNVADFSFNRFGVLNFYNNTIDFTRPIINPIADNALSYYRYKLLSASYDEAGRLVNKIEVIPRRNEDAVFGGIIYISEPDFRIYNIDLYLTAAAAKFDLIDTIHIKQQYIPVELDKWMILNQALYFNVSIFGIKIGGEFIAITSKYNLEPELNENFFTKEVMKILEGANKKDDEYWDEMRPVPLTIEEQKDYQVKDSIYEVRSSKPYMDSIDRLNNRFKFANITSYTHRRSYEGKRITVALNTNFNAVQGWGLGLLGTYRNNFNQSEVKKYIEWKGGYTYGWADKGHRGFLEWKKQTNAINYQTWTLRAGNELIDINPEHAYPQIYNSLTLLYAKDGMIRFYDNMYARIGSSRTLKYGDEIAAQIQVARRTQVENNSEYSVRKKEKVFPGNFPPGLDPEEVILGQNNMASIQLDYIWHPGRKYLSYPNQRTYIDGNMPTITLSWKSGFELSGAQSSFHQIKLDYLQSDVVRSIYGSLDIFARVGHFLQSPRYFYDYQHFNGGRTILMSSQNQLRGFKMLPVYSYSSAKSFAQLHMEWNDNSYLFDKIPLIRKLGLGLVAGSSHLWTDEKQHYTELNIGIDKIGYSIFRLMRTDFVWSFKNGIYDNWGWRFYINLGRF